MKGNKLTSNKADLQTPEIEQKIFAAFFAEVVTVGDVLLVYTWYRGDSRLGLLTSLFITTGGPAWPGRTHDEHPHLQPLVRPHLGPHYRDRIYIFH